MILQNSQLFELRGFNFLIYKSEETQPFKGGNYYPYNETFTEMFCTHSGRVFPLSKKDRKIILHNLIFKK